MPMTRFFSHEMASAHVTLKNGSYRPSSVVMIMMLGRFCCKLPVSLLASLRTGFIGAALWLREGTATRVVV
jgi:hypothetical protein